MTTYTSGAADALVPEHNSFRLASGPTPSATERISSLFQDVTEYSLTRDTSTEMPLHPSPSAEPKASRGFGKIDPSLIRDATALLDSIDPSDPYESTLHLASLSGILITMWETAVDSSPFHQDILATLENAILSLRQGETPSVSEDQVKAFREALLDLAQPLLIAQHPAIVHSQFLAAGFRPLAFMNTQDQETNADH
jgi:hypothetical protein